jgi:hypothetical protein
MAKPATHPSQAVRAIPFTGPAGAHNHTISAAISPLSANTSACVKISSGSGPIA